MFSFRLPSRSFAVLATVAALVACRDDLAGPAMSGAGAPTATPALSAGGGSFDGPQISWCPICKIAYTQYDTASHVFTVHTANPDLSFEATVYTGGTRPTWDQTHTRIAVSRTNGGITVMNADGTGTQDLTGRYDYEPNFAPDGARIVFERYMGDNTSDIWMTTANGAAQFAVTNTPGVSELGPQFSPDGKKLVYVRYALQPNTLDIVVLDLLSNATITIPVTSLNATFVQGPTFSPDGKRIAFSFQSNTSPNCLAMVNANGTNLAVVPRVADCRNPSWSPDGTQIALQTHLNPASLFFGRIGTLDLHSGKIYAMTQGPAESTPAWAR